MLKGLGRFHLGYIILAFFALSLVAGSFRVAGCSKVPESLILWEVRESSISAQLLQLRGIPFTSDGRGLVISRTEESYRTLVDALAVLRTQMDVIANNLANAQTTSARRELKQGEDGQTYDSHVPYCRKMVTLVSPKDGEGNNNVAPRPRELSVIEDTAPFSLVYDPDHPLAVRISESKYFGFVYYPNVNTRAEMVDMMVATREYEAVLAVVKEW